MKTNKPILCFCVGLPGSGKSYWAEANKEELNAVVHSSDEIREELTGDVNEQSKNELVFSTLHKRVKEDLLNGNNVIYDSTGLKRKNRIHALKQFEHIPCEKICVLFATPVECCLKNNANRERKVPEEVIERMYKNFEVPCKQEKWDKIRIVWWDYRSEGLEYDIIDDIEKWRSISHDNIHHSHSIGDHMIEVHEYMWGKVPDFLLNIAALMHDCGKIHTKKFIDSKGNPCEQAHFYQHHCCGSFLSLFYLKELFKNDYMKLTDDEILYVALLIELHMRPFLAWNNSEKSKEKDRRLFGDNVIKDIEILHECDLAAH